MFPICLFLRVGLNGIGWDDYEERLWDRPLLHFEYAYIGLPALDALPYFRGENLLGLALTALMKLPGPIERGSRRKDWHGSPVRERIWSGRSC